MEWNNNYYYCSKTVTAILLYCYTATAVAVRCACNAQSPPPRRRPRVLCEHCVTTTTMRKDSAIGVTHTHTHSLKDCCISLCVCVLPVWTHVHMCIVYSTQKRNKDVSPHRSLLLLCVPVLARVLTPLAVGLTLYAQYHTYTRAQKTDHPPQAARPCVPPLCVLRIEEDKEG